jgi:hypothetical protein
LSEITIPIFLVKQYQEKGAWHSVPATGYVSDRDVLLSWLRTKPIHPLNRESLNSPPTYKGMTTRYRWHALSAEHCYAQELGEGAVEIRDLSKKISAQLKSLEEKKPTQGAFSHTFFGAKKLDDLAQVSNDDLTKASDLEAESTVLTA